jgi:(S)-ureidoglycine aminohydrolase
MPLEGYPYSRLPTFPTAQVRVLASPRLGAQFVQYLIDLPAGAKGEFFADSSIETFFYVMSGSGSFDAGAKQAIRAGSFGLTPPGRASHFHAETPLQLFVTRKAYEPTPGVAMFKGLIGHEADVKKEVWANDEGALLQTLIPDEFQYDFAMNIFTFSPGHGLPIIETHVMEHGALILQGKGIYYLGDRWMEVEKDDFIYMAPYCPQSFYAAGTTAAKYIYYKNVNREISL